MEMVNLKRPLLEPQIEAIALEVVASYSSLNIADIHVIFRRARNGEFGDFYESLDMPKVMRWFADYFNERCRICAERSQSEDTGSKLDNETPADIAKYFNKLEKKFKR